jgi:hypothetical protein
LLRDTQTNWYVTAFGETFDITSISAIVENIYSNIANTPGFDVGKIGELFRTKDTSNREFLIRKEFGSLDVIDDSYYQNEIKNNFVAVLQKLNVEIDESDIDIDRLRNGKDALYDVQVSGLNDWQLPIYTDAIETGSAINTCRGKIGLDDSPLLLIYRLDKDAHKERNKKNGKPRESIATQRDVIAYAIIISGDGKDKVGPTTLSIM